MVKAGKGDPFLTLNSITRRSLNLNLGFRNENLNIALGANMMTWCSTSYYGDMPSFLYTSEIYAKAGPSFLTKSKNEYYFGPFGSFALLINDPRFGFLSYKLGLEYYSPKRLHVGAFFGLFSFREYESQILKVEDRKAFRSNEVGFTVGYSFPIRDPWIPHE